MKKKILFFTSILFFIFLLKKYFFNDFKKENNIRIGVMSGWYPFANLNSNNEIEGFDIDLIREIEKCINKKIIIKDLGSLSSLFISLTNNNIDAVLSGLDITQERKNNYSMIYYTGGESKTVSFLFNKENNFTIKDIYKKPLLVSFEASSSLEKISNYFESNFKNIKLDSSASLSEMILKLKYKKVNVLILENNVAKNIVKENNNLFNCIEIDLPKEFWIEGCGIALLKDNNELNLLLQNIINILKKNGTIKRLEEKWNL